MPQHQKRDRHVFNVGHGPKLPFIANVDAAMQLHQTGQFAALAKSGGRRTYDKRDEVSFRSGSPNGRFS